jgi:chromate transporter
VIVVCASDPRSVRGLVALGWTFLRLGCVSFGGPVAHLGYLRAELVARQRWLDDGQYGELVALCQFLPGPASSQVVFALGMHRAGLPGALLASACFTLPSAALMIALAYGVAGVEELQGAGWLHGLKLAAVAVVAHAVWALGRKLCPDRARVSLALVGAAVLLTAPSALAQFGVLALGAGVGWWRYRGDLPAEPTPSVEEATRGHRVAVGALGLFAALLVALPTLAGATGSRALAVFDSFYRAGSLVFGGGHVVLPLLREEVVPRGWVSDARFLAGYGAAQALPGPLFTFAAYLGASLATGTARWTWGLWCLLAIFLPAGLLLGGALPFWRQLRHRRGAQAALAGANAAVVGVLLAALYSPVVTEGVHTPRDVAAALLAFGALEHWKAPPWGVVAAMAAVGHWGLTG